MAPLSFFRGQGGGADSSSTTTTTSTTQVPPEAPRTPPPPGEALTAGTTSPGSAAAAGSATGAAAVSSAAGTGAYTSADQSPSSSSRLNPARLLRRKNSRSLRPPGDRDGRDRSRERGDEARWLGHALGLGHSHHSHSPSPDARKNGHASYANVNGSPAGVGAGVTSHPSAGSGVHGRRPSTGSASMPAPVHAVPSSPSIKPHAASTTLGPPLGSSAGAAASTTSLLTNSHSHQNSLASSNPGVSSTNYGSVRSFRSFRSDGASSLPGETETILGPSPDHPLIKGEPSVYHQPFALRPSTPPHGTYPTALSPPPPRRPQRSPIPPPPPRPTHGPPGAPRSRPGTPSSGSSADHADSSSRVPTSRVSERDYGLTAGVADEEDVRANTAAWLARKPSGRVKKRTGSSSRIKPERLPRAGSASSANLSRDSFSGDSVDEPASPAMSPPSDSFHSPSATFSKKFAPMPPRAEFPSSTALPLGGQRTSFLLPRPRTPERSGYAISVQCVPGADDEVKWEVVLRRTGASKGGAGSATGESPAPAGPVNLAAGESIAHTAPPLASSVNLSLALDTDSPSGKLVFITLPSDATPTRTRSRSSASTSASTSSPRVYPGTGGAHAPSARTAAPPLTFVRGDLYPSSGTRDTFVGPPASAPPGQLFPLHGPSVLGPPAPLSAPIAPPSAYVEPLSPRSAAYKRHGAVWASAGGIPGSPSPARPRIGSPDVFRSPLSSPDRAQSTPDRGSFESARQSLDGAVDMI